MQAAKQEKGIHISCRNSILHMEIGEILKPLGLPLSFIEETAPVQVLLDCRVLILDAPAAVSLLEAWRHKTDRPVLIVLREETDPPAFYFRQQGASACLNLENTTPVMLRRLALDYALEWAKEREKKNL